MKETLRHIFLKPFYYFSPHHSVNKENHTLKSSVDTSDLNDPKMLKTILEALQNKKKSKKKQPEDHPHFKRNSTIADGESRNLNINSPGKLY